MKYAETGFSLEIDLSSGRIEKAATDPRDTELYLGGQGIAAKILFERVPPDIRPVFSRQFADLQRRSSGRHGRAEPPTGPW